MDIKHGKYVEYHLNNNIPCLMSEYDNNLKTGKWTLCYSNGNIHIQCIYLNNVLDGLYIELNKDGTIIKKGNFVNGLKIGLWIENTEIGSYNDNKKHGIWIKTRFNLKQTSIYDTGRLLKQEMCSRNMLV